MINKKVELGLSRGVVFGLYLGSIDDSIKNKSLN